MLRIELPFKDFIFSQTHSNSAIYHCSCSWRKRGWHWVIADQRFCSYHEFPANLQKSWIVLR
ncbi:hypothetical protein SCA6_009283 [Theobroma cacao]